MPPMIKRAQRAAQKLLLKHNVSEPPVDVQKLAEELGATVQLERLDSNVSAILLRSPDGRATIGVNAEHHPNRRRFSIAHEIGHLLLHDDSPGVFVDEYMVHFRADASSRQTDPKEIEANYFAGALLMPEHTLIDDVRARQIDALDDGALRTLAERYSVSQQALTIRLVNLGLMAGHE
jgi:Zn-dependent peptidase ImmA (M78 family)